MGMSKPKACQGAEKTHLPTTRHSRAHDLKGVIPTPDIAKIFHLTPDIEGEKCPTPDIQNLP